MPAIVFSQTHCGKGEVDYFSCQIVGNEKVVSICGSVADSDNNADSWLQYRFGRIGKIELKYPAEKKNSVSKFEGNWFNRYNVVDLRFINGQAIYNVALNDRYGGDGEAPARKSASGEVNVEVGKLKPISLACKHANARKYYRLFTDLAAELRQRNGATDIVYEFHKNASK